MQVASSFHSMTFPLFTAYFVISPQYMTLVQLEYIVAVDSFRHFAEAARHCYVTQPTLSMQISKLEQELGIQLFDRSKQPVVPTEAGAALIVQARRVLTEFDLMNDLVQEH